MQTDVVVIHKHPLFVNALEDVLLRIQPKARIHGFSSVAMALQGSKHYVRPIVCLDVSLCKEHCADVITKLRHQWYGATLMVLADEDHHVNHSSHIGEGAFSVIPKGSSVSHFDHEFRRVIQHRTNQCFDAASCETPSDVREESLLTLRQQEVLALVAKGLCNKRIARELHIAEATTKAHIYAIFRTLAVSSRTKAVLQAKTMGLLSTEPW